MQGEVFGEVGLWRGPVRVTATMGISLAVSLALLAGRPEPRLVARAIRAQEE